jgi:serine/threonine protein kinase
VTWLSDAVVAHLRQVVDWPDLTGTRYELIEKIGQGGMGTIYRARDCELDRPVALKVVSVPGADEAVVARALREARIVARLEHPGIVPVHDAGRLSDGRFFYAMKLVRGHRLDEAAARPAALTERLRLFQKICDAVAFAHAHGVLHRDLKPQNIMLGPFGEVLVMDWGVAKEVGDGSYPPRRDPRDIGKDRSPETAHGTVLGTPGYMPPEQARGEQELMDERTDVYALGAVLHFLLTGRAPVADAAGAPGPMLPRRHDRSIPRSLEAVCLKALAAERQDRYANVPDLAEDIRNFLSGLPVRAYPENLLDTARRLGAKYRAVIALIVAYLLMRVVLLMAAG